MELLGKLLRGTNAGYSRLVNELEALCETKTRPGAGFFYVKLITPYKAYFEEYANRQAV